MGNAMSHGGWGVGGGVGGYIFLGFKMLYVELSVRGQISILHFPSNPLSVSLQSSEFRLIWNVSSEIPRLYLLLGG